MDFNLLRPELALLATAIAVIVIDLFYSRKGVLTVLSLIGLLVAGFFTFGIRGSLAESR